ncbi:unnamed protein product [Cylindrotheca closterium]|uniref:Uncharacterized protein n=1 Tax=Cylindrotheca closterium TaxID=2856 RepID=A0AAD2CWH1_9STRA|nr:unnamed protein product [Cylindrotheca closterium]
MTRTISRDLFFAYKTADATTNQYGKISYVLDCMTAETYLAIPAPPGSKHGLPTFKSNRPESMLEKFHELLAYYCNIGCGDEFANAIIMKGWAEYNSWDLGHGDLFSNYEKPPSKNNGEVFLKNYFNQQVERNRNQLFDKDSKQCTCNECIIPAGPPPAVPAAGVEDNNSHLLTCQLTCQMDLMALDDTSTATNAVTETPPMRVDPPRRQQTFGYCFPFHPYRCDDIQNYVKRRQAGKVVCGIPPHSFNCPTKSMLKGWAPVD